MISVTSKQLFQSNKLERIWLLAKIEFKLRYYENKLGLFWALFKPIMDIFLYYIIFQVVMQQDMPDFASFLFIGLIFWNFFLESTSGTIQILKTKKYLYEYSNMNKLEIYISTILSNVIGFFFNLVMFLLFYHFIQSGKGLAPVNLWLIPLFINLFILSLGVSLILSCTFILAHDITQIWGVVSSFMFFLSPIFFKLITFKETLPGFDYINPISGIVINARNVMMLEKLPDWELFIFDFGYATFLLLTGLLLLNKLGSKAAEKL